MKVLLHRQLTGLSAATSPFSGLSRVTTFVLTAAGTGYVVGELLTVSGGTAAIAAQFRVVEVSGGGVITTLVREHAGVYTSKPSNAVSTTSDKSGTGCTLTLTWRDNCPPGGTRQVVIQAETQNLRWREDGTDPSSTVGQLLTAGSTLTYIEQSFAALKIIETTTSAKANITIYG